jgi:hypothetical protein
MNGDFDEDEDELEDDDPVCPECGYDLYTENHDWDCGYDEDEDDEL